MKRQLIKAYKSKKKVQKTYIIVLRLKKAVLHSLVIKKSI